MADETMAGRFGILDLIERGTGSRPEPASPQAAPAEAEPEPPDGDEFPALPVAGDAYRPHARLSSRPVTCVFFLPKSMLPSGFLYHGLERVWMEAGERPGLAPRLVARFNGSEVTEVVMEGRNLAPLCMAIGRMAVAWIRELPAGETAGDDAATVVRSIAYRNAQ